MNPLDLEFIEALTSRPTLEEELSVEKRVLEIKETENIEDLRKHAIVLQRQNLHQSYFIANCLEQIAKLQGKLVAKKIETPVKQPTFKNFLRKLFDL